MADLGEDDEPAAVGGDASASDLLARLAPSTEPDGADATAKAGDPTRPLACAPEDEAAPRLVRLPGGGAIDATEVTQCQYAAWLATKPSTHGQPKACAFNHDFAPDAGCMLGARCVGAGCERHPQVCVDWCDARAYCEAHGKRLCGAVGGGGPVPYDRGADPAASEWMRACVGAQPDSLVWPYGASHLPHGCNDWGHGVYRTVPVGSMPICQSQDAAYAGVFDLSGNVFEWEDSCDGQGGADDHCRVRGGGFIADWEASWCGTLEWAYATRGMEFGDGWSFDAIGIRCCAD